MKIYTGKGDMGQTSIWGGVRMDKDSPRLEALGQVDACAFARPSPSAQRWSWKKVRMSSVSSSGSSRAAKWPPRSGTSTQWVMVFSGSA